jgi:CO/xanthine dehydrogenase FAD-binding subunit
MYPALPEEYLVPTTLEDAVAALARNAEARVIAGGMSLMQLVKSRHVRPRCLVDLRRVASLRQVQVDASGVSIGAMVRHRDLAAERRPSPRWISGRSNPTSASDSRTGGGSSRDTSERRDRSSAS